MGGQQELFDQFVRGNVDMMITWPQTSCDQRMAVNFIPHTVMGWDDAIQSYGKDGWLTELVLRWSPKTGHPGSSLPATKTRKNSVAGKRKNYGAEFKAKVALEAIRGELTVAELVAKRDANVPRGDLDQHMEAAGP